MDDKRLIRALVNDAAQCCEYAADEVNAKLRNSAFLAEYYNAKANELRYTAQALRDQASVAVAALGDIASDPDAAPEVRARAAQLILQNVTPFADMVDDAEKMAAKCSDPLNFMLS